MGNFYISVSNGLLKDNHRKRIGTAVWEFMWCLDKITKIDEKGIGYVLGGKPIKLAEIARQMNFHKNTVSQNLAKLEKEGYIHKTLTPYGIVIRVMKAKKRFTGNSEPRTQNSEPNKIVSVDNTIPELSKKKDSGSQSMKNDEFYEEPKIDEDGNILPEEKKVSGKGGQAMKELLGWAKSVHGRKFTNAVKQFAAMKRARIAGFGPEDIKRKWNEMEQDDFWSEKGFDFNEVVSQLSKKNARR